jgi:hypothetical protein
MARIFTTKFHFNDREYDAIISVISSNGNLSFNVKVLDADLFDLIPNGNIEYTGKDGFRQLDPAGKHPDRASLMNAIATSIELHLVHTP